MTINASGLGDWKTGLWHGIQLRAPEILNILLSNLTVVNDNMTRYTDKKAWHKFFAILKSSLLKSLCSLNPSYFFFFIDLYCEFIFVLRDVDPIAILFPSSQIWPVFPLIWSHDTYHKCEINQCMSYLELHFHHREEKDHICLTHLCKSRA